MEIRNNTPSFGMAFIKPQPEQMVDFTKYVIDGKRNPKSIKRGLRQLQKTQSNNKHFDLSYGKDNTITVIPTSIKALEMFEPMAIKQGEGKPRHITKIHNTIVKEEKILELTNAGTFKQIKFGIKSLAKMFNAAVYTLLHPIELLPKNLRYANELATSQAKIVEKEIAKDKLIEEALR